jgi:hypothetical protein
MGKHIYVCEDVDPIPGLAVGQEVQAGQTIAYSHYDPPNGCCWTEWGWADGPTNSPLTRYAGRPDGYCTEGGIAFARFLHNLGAPLGRTDICPRAVATFGTAPEWDDGKGHTA